jgi:hypothetical protein
MLYLRELKMKIIVEMNYFINKILFIKPYEDKYDMVKKENQKLKKSSDKN